MTYYLSETQIYARHGERWAFEQLQSLGYHVSPLGDFNNPEGDLLVNGILRIEVKISSQGKCVRKGCKTRPRWSWNCDTVDEYCALILIAEGKRTGHYYPYIMPGAVMRHRSVFAINSHPNQYRGRTIAPYLNRWQTIKEMLAFYQSQDVQAIMPAITA